MLPIVTPEEAKAALENELRTLSWIRLVETVATEPERIAQAVALAVADSGPWVKAETVSERIAAAVAEAERRAWDEGEAAGLAAGMRTRRSSDNPGLFRRPNPYSTASVNRVAESVPWVSAEHLADRIAEAERRGAAEALQERADAVRWCRENGLKPGEDHAPSSESFEQWLRDAADECKRQGVSGERS